VMPTAPGLYWYVAQVNNALRCVIPDTAYVKLVPDSLDVSVDGPMKVCEGDEVCLDAIVTPNALMAMVTWTDESGSVVGTGLQLCVTPGPGTHTYTAVADNGCTTAMDMATVRVLSDTTKIEITPADTVTLCAPEEVCFEVTDTSLWDCIQWVDASGVIIGTGGSLCVTTTNPGLSYYIARVDSTLRCVIPDTAYVELAPQDISVSVSPDTSKLCVGDIVGLTATVFPDTSMATITWFDDSGNIVGDGNSLVLVASEVGAFKFTAVADNGCTTAMDMAWVYVFAEDTKLEIDPDRLIVCTPDTVCLTVQFPTPECLVWTTLDGTVVGTGEKLCFVPEPGENVFIADIPGVDCIEADTAVVILAVPDLSVEVMPSDTIVCQGDSVKLTAIVTPDDAMADITWYDEDYEPLGETGMMITVSPDTTGAFTYIAIADNGCAADTAMATIIVVDSMKLAITPGDTILCAPDTLKLSVENEGSDYVVWYDENGDSIGTGMMITVVPDYGIHSYIAQIPEADCVEGDTVMVKVLPDTLDLNVIASDSLVCAGDEITFTAQLDPDWTMAQVTWYDEMDEEAGSGDTLIVAAFAGPNTYYAVADNGCVTASDTATVEGKELMLDISAVPPTICADMGEQSQLAVTGCADCTYTWDNTSGTLSDPSISNPIATPNVTTTYSVTITDGVCTETLSVTVTVEDCPVDCPVEEFYIATAFTPNNDDINDFVCLRSEHFDKFSEIELMIYNRWGQEVFRESYTVGSLGAGKFPDADFFCWDGMFKGEVLPPDVYGYYLRVVCPETDDRAEEVREQKGNISLLQR
ncbi:MAG: gliding motility-associated C-terminal domain-containing protein, partial [Phaeodactylibacter sp.]|nr:gliding motility-associated C-terminal domain-containing protein [Phaeodactylibacter sp.]